MSVSHYETLQVPPTASVDDIRASYKRLVLRCHPDRTSDANTATFQTLQHAYAVLQDTTTRVEYDRQLALQAEASMVAVSDDLTLDDLQEGPDGTRTALCRCGGHFLLGEADLKLGLHTILLPCDTCSLLVALHLVA